MVSVIVEIARASFAGPRSGSEGVAESIDKLLALPDKEIKSLLRMLRKKGLVAQA